ncbi:C40 family peptidase [Streptomyces sp. AC536]|uniref:C40 family peptidase n=1 Tax=Streptomyces buecherae TaxID=2763006 RepID=UPI00164D7B5C|nr:C40 family peptidase [Streptomyces buecherae]MBC3982106.1 C40 family peptidase [Streptomyces buecherae]QNJ41966.1 C40 family peptidase [Streptomyces buecherae]
MASHRRSRPRLGMPSGRRTAAGLTTAALVSLALLAQVAPPATAAPREPRPSVEEVRQRVDTLYREAGSATQAYNGAKERTDAQQARVDELLGDVAEHTERVNEARRKLGSFAAAQYRSGSAHSTATLLLAADSKSLFDQSHLLARMTSRQQRALTDYEARRSAAATQRGKATQSLASLTAAQEDLRAKKKSVRAKLAEARKLLSRLTAEEKARLAELERKKQAEAERKARELARQQAEKEREEREQREREQREREERENSGDTSDGGGTGDGSGQGEDAGAGDGSGDIRPSDPALPADTAKAQQAIDFARAQLGKPYVWGATGPDSYDCSGLTRGAWQAAGVALPRTTWDQVKVGKRIATTDLAPGDLVFFYEDSSHVGLYIGEGQMIHAPRPGANVRIESIFTMPLYGNVRPA